MRFLLVIFLCLLPMMARAQIAADFIVHMEGLSRGVLTESTVRNGLAGTHNNAYADGVGDFTRFYVVSNQFTNRMSVTVNGTNYAFGGTNMLKFITETNIADNIFTILLASDDGTTLTNGHMFGHCKWSITNNTGSLMNIDPLIVSGGGGSWFVGGQWQMQPANSSIRMTAHSNEGTGNYVDYDGLTEIVCFWEIVFVANTWGYFKLRNVNDNYSVIGTGDIEITDQGEPFGHLWKLEFKTGYIGDPPGAIYMDDFAVRFNNTNFLTDAELGLDPIIASTNRMNWKPGETVGVYGGIPERTGTVIDLSQAPYNIPTTMAGNAGTVINTALAAASSNDVVLLPAGTFNCLTNGVSHNYHGVTLRGQGTNSVIVGTVTGGHSASGAEYFAITNGGTRGTTNVVVSDFTDAFANTITAGEMMQISAFENDTNGFAFSVTGYRRIISQICMVHSRSGSTVSLSAPLVWDFTNNAALLSKSLTGNSGLNPKMRLGFESFMVTSTNVGGYRSAATALLSLSLVRDSWLSNVVVEYPNNYGVFAQNVFNVQMEHCTVRHTVDPAGTSRSGFYASAATGFLIQNNIFHDLGVSIQFADGFSGNAIFGNFDTNIVSNGSVLCHGAHPVMNLIEHNKWSGPVVYDGYFGSYSDQSLVRNEIKSTVGLKKNGSAMQVVGNVLGATNLSYTYSNTNNGYTTPYSIIELGFPGIGNTGYTGESPTNLWNNPGSWVNSYLGSEPDTYTNGTFVFTNTARLTNTLWTTDGTGILSNYPAPYQDGYPIRVRASNNWHKYFPDDNSIVLTATNGNETNLVLDTAMWFTNGMRVFIGGQNAYHHRVTGLLPSHNLTGNRVLTNQAGVTVWSASNQSRVIPTSYIYTNGAPGWWNTNELEWPAIGPDVDGYVNIIPPEARFNEAGGGEGEEGDPGLPATTISGRVSITGRVRIQ